MRAHVTRSLLTTLCPLLTATTACPGTSPYPQPHSGSGSVSTGRHLGGSSAGAASGSGGSGSGGTGGATGTSTTGGGQTTGSQVVTTLLPCDAGVQVRGSLVQLALEPGAAQPPVTSPLQVQDPFDPSLVATTDSNGDFQLCVQPEAQAAVEVETAGFVSAQIATVAPTQSLQFPPIPMIPSAYLPLIQCVPAQSSSSALIAIEVMDTNSDWSTAGAGPSGVPSCKDREGWSFVLTDADGGALDAGLTYKSGTLCGADTATDPSGFALAVIPISVGQFRLTGTLANNSLPDGGPRCTYVGADPHFALTGLAQLSSGYLTFVPYVVRPATFALAGESCWTNADCAGSPHQGLCNPSGADSGLGSCCYLNNYPCSAPSDCCGGNACVAGPGGGPSTCCVSSGLACNLSSDCCAGLSCGPMGDGGVCQ